MIEQLIVDGSISASDMNVFSGINVLFGSEDIELALYGDNGRRVGDDFSAAKVSREGVGG
jgi:hypothetical protein